MPRLRLALCIGLLAGPGLASPALTVAPAKMRAAANPYSAVVQAVPAHAQVDIQSCGGEWCYGSWRGLYGFLPSVAVAQAGAPPPIPFSPPPPPLAVTAAPVLIGPPVVWGGPTIGFGWGVGRW